MSIQKAKGAIFIDGVPASEIGRRIAALQSKSAPAIHEFAHCQSCHKDHRLDRMATYKYWKSLQGYAGRCKDCWFSLTESEREGLLGI